MILFSHVYNLPDVSTLGFLYVNTVRTGIGIKSWKFIRVRHINQKFIMSNFANYSAFIVSSCTYYHHNNKLFRMITGLYETHLFVESLERSTEFYENVLGLELCYREQRRKVSFFWIGRPKEAMLGLWEKPKHQIEKRHIAFRCSVQDVLQNSVSFLKERNLRPRNFLNDPSETPMVFAWMPAIAIYFDDPDGHELEFIAVLEGEGRPELGVLSYSQWLEKQVGNEKSCSRSKV